VSDADPQVDPDSIFLWFKPLDVLKISAGTGFGDSPAVDYATGGGPGIQFLVTPIEGLTIGLTLNNPVNLKGLDATNTTVDSYDPYKPEYFLQETALGVKYEADLFKVHAALKLDSEADSANLTWDAFGLVDYLKNLPTPVEYGTYKPTAAEKEIFASAGVSVTAVPNLTITVAGKVENLADWASDGAARAEIYEKFAYKISDAFSVSLMVKEVLYSFEDSPTGLHGEAGLGYKINDTYKVNLGLGANNWLLSDKLSDDWKGFHNDNIWIKPSVDITVGEKASITVYYQATIQNTLKDLPDRPLKSAAQVNFVWSF
jgi:hypothetical protein